MEGPSLRCTVAAQRACFRPGRARLPDDDDGQNCQIFRGDMSRDAGSPDGT